MSVNNSDDQEAGPTKRQKLGDEQLCFRSNDMELLRTGRFSDAQVTAGNRVWKVHKSIVCQRSGFMRQVLAGPFEQGQAAIVRIDVCTEGQLDLVLEFIYSGSIEATGHLSLAVCVELMMLGKRLIVEELTIFAMDTLWDKLRVMVVRNSIMPEGRSTHQFRITIDANLEELNFNIQFQDAIRAAYGSSNIPAQLILADFVWLSRSWLLGNSIIEQLNVEFPQFGSHVFTTLNKGPQVYPLPGHEGPHFAVGDPAQTQCSHCDQHWNRQGGQTRWLYHCTNLELRPRTISCSDCVARNGRILFPGSIQSDA